jgi:ribonuclease D
MVTAPKSEAILITRQSDLKILAEQLLSIPTIAVDTESNSLHAYAEQVCLLQFSVPSMDYLIDPLALKDLACLAPIFASPEIEKIFHAAEYDIICLKRDYGFCFTNIFDTMLAARILGRPAVGLGNMLETEFGLLIDKRYQRANWGQRPLPDHLLDYARMDTHYLIALRERLAEELKRYGLTTLAQEDFRRITYVKGNGRLGVERAIDPYQLRGAKELDGRGAAILRELCLYREKMARLYDRPPFKVINDSTLVAIAAVVPTNLQELSKIQGMTRRQVQRHGNKLLEAIRRGKHSAPLLPNYNSRPDDAYLARLDRLRNWRKETAEKMAVTSDVILPRDMMFNLVEANPRTLEEINIIMEDVPWRLERFGTSILESLLQEKKKDKS